MTFKDMFSQIKIIPLENTFKQLHEQFPERNLQLPHSGEYVSDILKLASQKTGNSFPDKLLENRLEEELFFRSGFDTELYRHLRYLPANWHTHSFLEVVCVVEGQAVNHIQEQELHMCKGDICIIAPETVHAISAFSDDCIIINIVLRTSTLKKYFSACFRITTYSLIFLRTPCIIRKHTLICSSVQAAIRRSLILYSMLTGNF